MLICAVIIIKTHPQKLITMKQILFLLIIFVLAANAADAQKLKKAYAHLRAGEYEEAESMFNKATKKRVEPGAAYFALATIRFDTASGRKNNQAAFDLFQKAKDRLAREDSKKLDAYQITYGMNIKASTCDSMMRLCALQDLDAAYRNLSNYICSATDTASQKFLAKYGKKFPDLKAKLTYSIDSLDYQIACYFAKKWIFSRNQLSKKNPYSKCIKCFDEIWDDQRPHPFKDSVMTTIKAIQQEIYDEIVADGDYMTMNSFRWEFDPTFQKEMRYLYSWFYYSNTYPFEAQPKDTALMWEIYKFACDTSKAKFEEPNLKKYIKQFAPTQYGFNLLKRLTRPYLEEKQWETAINYYLEFRDAYVPQREAIDKIIGILSEPNPPAFIDEQRLPDQINSPVYVNDYAPVISPDMTHLYFCRDMDMRDGAGQEDMYVSEFKDGNWTEAKPIDRFATLYANEATEHIYPDLNMMVLFKNGDFWVSEIQENGTWGAPYLFESKTDKYGENGVNGGFWQADAYFSADGQVMLFASRRSSIDTVNVGGLTESDFWGNIDIYASVKGEDGQWGMPFNIGKTINTPYTDRSPRLSPDLKTLFFTSNGHYGLGGLDIFMSRRLSDTSWTQWSEPVNLGRCINSAFNEMFFFNAYDGKTIFYSKSNSNVNNNQEIYTAKLPEKFRAETTSILSGIVTDSDGRPIHSNIIWEDLNTGTYLGNLKNDPVSGTFSITLPLGRQYEYFIEADGYLPMSGIFDTRNAKETQYQSDSITIHSINEIIEDSLCVVIKNIFFDFDKYDLKPESMGEIRHLAKFLAANPDLTVQIAGHTDNVGSDQHNQQLSENRAKAVKDALVALGIPATKIVAKGYGSTRPISNVDAENRRVEFSIFGD